MNISVVIPTYNREEDLLNQLTKIDVCDSVGIKVEIFDDCSQSQYNKIASFNFKYLNVVLRRNLTNLGFSKNILYALRKTSADYVVLMADDDELVVHNVKRAIKYLERVNADFASPLSYISGNRYRGVKQCREIKNYEFMQASSRAPGLIFKVSTARKYLDKVSQRIDSGCSFCSFYPQTALMLYMLADEKNCIFIPIVLDRIGFNRPTGLKTSSGATFWSFEARAHQLSDLCRLIQDAFSSHDHEVMLNAANMSYSPRLVGIMPLWQQFVVLWICFRRAIWRSVMSCFNPQFKELVRRILRHFGR
ncbi:glycosyltransferase family 2 protein [Roseobacter sp. HKCCD5988]|uniref:glycosyltransferase family 2 protein n=1 Tax=Roseobacter sp. HKCCD5988 TaxID=3120338 RepID=UPI0030EB4728